MTPVKHKLPTLNILNLQSMIALGRAFKPLVNAAIKEIIISENYDGGGTVNICVMDDAAIRGINRKYLSSDSATDVISFNLKGTLALEAEIAVSAETALRVCARYGNKPSTELLLYIIHGLYHAIGYKDDTRKSREIMDRKSAVVLKRIMPDIVHNGGARK